MKLLPQKLGNFTTRCCIKEFFCGMQPMYIWWIKAFNIIYYDISFCFTSPQSMLVLIFTNTNTWNMNCLHVASMHWLVDCLSLCLHLTNTYWWQSQTSRGDFWDRFFQIQAIISSQWTQFNRKLQLICYNFRRIFFPKIFYSKSIFVIEYVFVFILETP